MLLSSHQIRLLRKTLKASSAFLKADAVLVFTCGAERGSSGKTCRESIVEYADRHLKGFRFFEAEAFFRAFAESAKSDLLTLEEKLAGYSDCILIVLESPGAVAELGAFTLHNDLAKIVLAVNERRFRDSTSFISLGPLKKVDKASTFRPTVYADFSSILTAIPDIEKRLSKIKRYNGKSVDLSTYDGYQQLEPKLRLMFLSDLISLLSPIRFTEIIDLMRTLYGEHDFDINEDLALLHALELIGHDQDKYYYATYTGLTTFFDLRFDNMRMFRASVIGTYSKLDRRRLRVLVERELQGDGIAK